MKPVREIVGRDVIDDLWGAGYTILPRKRHVDPFFVPPEIIPQGRSYQWWHLVHDQSQFINTGWAAVPAERHDGYFMPAGFIGNIEVMGLGLFDKPKHEVEAERLYGHAKAHQNVADWIEKQGEQFAGSVTVAHQTKLGELDNSVTTEVGRVERHDTKTIETTVSIPPDMLPRLLYAERDKLYAELQAAVLDGTTCTRQREVLERYYEALENDQSIPKGPTFNALLLPWAVENVRKQLKEKS